MTHKWSVGDIVESELYNYRDSLLYLIKELDVQKAVNTYGYPFDVDLRIMNLKVIWKQSKGTAPMWPIGISVMTPVHYIYPPTNEMLALVLYAEPSTQLGE